jgi:dimethylaniline monooxygenase (N-oxide forming)
VTFQSKRVAVVGAGPSGLVTVKELLEEGHQPTCFERASNLGGVFRFSEDDGVVWESCRLTSSGLLTQFSDFPASPDETGHMTARQYVGYLTRYCETFNVTSHIRFNTTVESVKRCSDGSWSVETRNGDVRNNEQFAAVAICSGLHQYPSLPKLRGQETFVGTVFHGAQYRRPAQVLGKKVLIIGGGESGADIVAEVSAHAAETVLSLRRGVAVLPRIMFGKPIDYQTSRLHNSAAHWVFQTRNPKDDRQRTIYRWVCLPVVVVDKCLQVAFNLAWHILPQFYAPRLSEIRINLKTRKIARQLLKESGGSIAEQFGTKSDEFVRAIAAGACRRVPAVDRFEGARVWFTDGTHFEPDVVIFCTGFETKTRFLDGINCDAPRYLHTFYSKVGPSLGFIGFVRPAYGAIPPLAELQARWFALVQTGGLELPAEEEIRRSIEYWTRFRAHIFSAVRDRLDYLVDHTPFCDELAARIGCKPTRDAIRRENLGFRLRFFAGPFVAAQYRLVGPHAKPEIARGVIANLPIKHPLPDLINLYLRWGMSRVLHRAFGPEFVPKLEIR